jgi:hypothetical protein
MEVCAERLPTGSQTAIAKMIGEVKRFLRELAVLYFLELR